MQGWEWAINTLSVQTPSHTILIQRMKEEKKKTVRDKKRTSKANKDSSVQLLKLASPTPLNTGSPRPYYRDTDRWIKVLWYCKVLQQGGTKVDCWVIKALHVSQTSTYMQHQQTSTLFMVEHHKEGASDCTWSCTAYRMLPRLTMCKVTLKHTPN